MVGTTSPDDFHWVPQSAVRLQQTVDSLPVLFRPETASAEVPFEGVVPGPLVDECLAPHMDCAKQRNWKSDPRRIILRSSRLCADSP